LTERLNKCKYEWNKFDRLAAKIKKFIDLWQKKTIMLTSVGE